MSALRTPAGDLLRAVHRLGTLHPLAAHAREATTALGYHWLLTDGDVWFLNAIKRLPRLSDRQTARLHEVCAKVERGRG